MTNNDDLSQIPSPTAVHLISADSITNRSAPQRIIVIEPIVLSSTKVNSVNSVTDDFNRLPTASRGYIESPWTNSSTFKTKCSIIGTTTVTTESISRPTPAPISRILSVQFIENNKISTPRSPLPLSSIVLLPPPPNVLSTATKTIETNNHTNSLTCHI
jgi:hypothetical protein